MSAKLLANENYMDDAISSYLSNLMQGLSRKKEMSFWDSVEMLPSKGKSDFTMHESYPTNIFKSELVNEDVSTDLNKLPSPKEKVFHRDSIENYSIKKPKHNNVSDKGNYIRKIVESNNSDENDKHIPTACLHNQQVLPQSHVIDIVSDTQNTKIYNSNYQKRDNRGSLGSNLPDNSRFFSDTKLDCEENCVNIKEQFVENVNSDYQELESMSSRFKSRTKDIQKNVNLINSEKAKNKFDSWCENRRKEHITKSNLKQSNISTLTAMTTKVKEDISIRKPTNKNEYEDVFFNPEVKEIYGNDTVVENNTSFSKRKVFLDGTISNEFNRKDDCQMDKSIAVSKEVPVKRNSHTIKNVEIDDPIYQKVPKISDKILKDYISERNSQIIAEISYDNKNMMGFKKHVNIKPKILAVEKILNISTKETISTETEQMESSKSFDFVTEADDRNEFKNGYKMEKECNSKCSQNGSYRQSPRFINDKDETGVRPKKQSVSKKVHLKSKSNEDLKMATFKKKRESSNFCDSSKCVSNSRNDHCFLAKENAQLCIRITDDAEYYDDAKYFDFVADPAAIKRIKKTLPKLAADIPDVDSKGKEMSYSADALNIILRFVFCRSFEFDKVMPHVIICLEVLAAAQSWNIDVFFKLFQEKFLQSGLTSKNASEVFSHAYHYNLKEICDACKSISMDTTDLNTTTPQKRQKSCFVSISTYIEPLEINIPFEPAGKDISLSFPKQIHNKFTFKAISGCFSIIGFQIQLNEEYTVKKQGELTIDYSIKYIKDD